MIESILVAIVTGSISLLGVIINNNKTTVILNERLEAYQQRVNDQLSALHEILIKHDDLLDKVIALEVDQRSQWHIINELKEYHKNGKA